MKWISSLMMVLLCVGMLATTSSCKKEKETATCSDGKQNGDETGVDCGGTCPACEVGVQGKWWSKGADVALLLKGAPFNIDSIYAEFNTNMTYTVVSYSGGTGLTLTGTYTQSASGVGDIWNITVQQSSPSVLTSVGIFEVVGNNMTYEIVQTEPAIGAVPPTAAGGFGSTNGGALGTLNVQKYVRVN